MSRDLPLVAKPSRVRRFGCRWACPCRHCNAGRRVKVMERPGVEAMAGERLLRSLILTERRKQRSSTRNSRKGGPGEVESVIKRQKHIEHLASADDCDDSAANAEFGERYFQRYSGRIPQQRVGKRWVRRDRRGLVRNNQTFAARGARSAFMGVATMHDSGSPIEFRLEEPLVGVVAESCPALLRRDRRSCRPRTRWHSLRCGTAQSSAKTIAGPPYEVIWAKAVRCSPGEPRRASCKSASKPICGFRTRV